MKYLAFTVIDFITAGFGVNFSNIKQIIIYEIPSSVEVRLKTLYSL